MLSCKDVDIEKCNKMDHEFDKIYRVELQDGRTADVCEEIANSDIVKRIINSDG